jgi:mRNA interferase MazF
MPDRGDVVHIQCSPQAGHEQAGPRPALVLSPSSYNAKTGLMICCPITNQAKGYPFEVPIVPGPGSQMVTGVALADQLRCFDFVARGARKIGFVAAQCSQDVGAKSKALLP